MLIKNDLKIVNGAKAIIQTLSDFGVDTIFGYPGGVVLDLYDELYKQSNIKHILVRHEQSAVHCAEGYARATGKCGVVFVTSGPGATNTVTGIANAYLDGSPLLVITGQVSYDLLGKKAFQEADICEITKSCAKKVFRITDANELQKTLFEAYTTATKDAKGPVVVDIVKDVFTQSIKYTNILALLPNIGESTSVADCADICSLILKSSKPVIVTGGGVIHSQAQASVYKFAKSYSVPVVSTMMGLGAYPADDENYFGMLGIFGDNSANEIVKQADLVISLGVRWNDRITCMFKNCDLGSKLIQIDINPDEIGRVIKPAASMKGDIKAFFIGAGMFFGGMNKYSQWLNSAQDFKKLNTPPKKISNMLHSFEVIQKIEEFTKEKDLIFTSEVGQHMLWAVKNLKLGKNRKLFVSGGLGTMGFGLPAAIGACIANPKNPVVCISGDGSFQMNLNELATCKDYNLNLKIMILNNGYLGMVRQLQEKNCEGRYSQTKISNPDFVKLAQSYGIEAIKVTSLSDVDYALKKAFSNAKTFIIDFEIEPMEVV